MIYMSVCFYNIFSCPFRAINPGLKMCRQVRWTPTASLDNKQLSWQWQNATSRASMISLFHLNLLVTQLLFEQ